MAQADGAEKELQVEFIFTDPAEEDTPYVRSLLAGGSLCTATGADAAGLAATVANQVEVGTMIKADGALFGFLSAVSLQRHRADPSVGRLISLLGSDRVEDGPLRQRLAGLLAPSGGANVGLLLSERMVNTPVQLVPHAVESLHLDLGWAAANAEPAAERASLTFEWLVLLAHEELLAEGAEAVSLVRGGLPGGGQLLLMLLRPEALAAAVPAMRAVMCD
ncbi:hypothetical protein EMIHUDRAFT_451637 [Emiliania huxleyi CCMP1516]|uniref:Uncharacterized protein n=2 Tax=Emiliania huxleyi TaxID=2903 RepID=A0A0D3IXQ7_EMIH1|nr:hypothetical protein EMIHUDRAFT_451637 [Emiliania huxleyi CCMP1516]EOD16042.1 hypothetical protein EMIHUDRAFT_451637 [Emiliania huxleyi CCMP1516]|eukprot:XP_005768471.1 hypothetical protein EMIHUDRAFT_451637 [Emiliania huxleyi CCMP1516]